MTTHALDTDGYCVHSDLPPEQCAAERCRPDARPMIATPRGSTVNELLVPSQIERRTTARHVSVVACGHHALPGTRIALGPDGWICGECDPGPGEADE